MARRILLALDDTESSQQMFNWVLDNELQPDVQVHLLHVILGGAEEHHNYLPHADYFEQALPGQQHKVVLEMLSRRYLGPLAQVSIKPTIHLVHGSLDPKTVGCIICRKAQELRVDCCFVASKLQHTSLLGKVFHTQTTAEYCEAQCEVPLTVVAVPLDGKLDGIQIQRHGC
eukprot:GHUV01005381.1.p1 GENE.GHUV01005381.1~~GHUV01005381.1.p1  ORF type:complete len:172 (+),score=49.34 GHUV01005381.1:376-891(+)